MDDSVDLSCIDPAKPTLGCRKLFPFKDYPGLCARCLHLSQLSDPEEVRRDAASPTCSGCGGIFAHLAPNTQCGICERKGASQQSASRELQASKHTARANAVLLRTLKKTVPTSVSLAVSANQASGAQGGREILVFLAVTNPRTMAWNKLGVASDSFLETIPFHEVTDKLVKIWNVKWETSSKESLKPEFIDIHLHGHISFLPESDTDTLGHFYDVHDSMLSRDHTKRCPSGTKPGKGPFVYLEGFIDVAEFELATQAAAPDWIKTEKELKQLRKKRKSIGLPSEPALDSKRSRASSLQSSWLVRVPQGSTKVELLCATIKINEKDQHEQVLYPDIEGNTVTAYLWDEEFDRGATKVVYKLILDSKEWVAKRFWHVGRGDDTVSASENREEVESEGLRLNELHRILEEFKKHAKKHRVDIATDIQVTEFKIAVEIVQNDRPSPASGISASELALLASDQRFIAWLIEPMRPKTATKKWSGTMQHPDHNNKVGDTLTSFVHFAYQWTYKTQVFADLQTTKVGAAGGGCHILFDVMCHTLAGESGIGDHGLIGIQTFLNMHKCERKCRDLKLEPLQPVKASDSSEKEADDLDEEGSDT